MFKKNKKIKKEKDFDKEKSSGKLRKILFFILLILFFGVAGWTLFFSSLVKIQHVEIDGFQEDEVSKIVRDTLNNRYWRVIPQDNILMLLPFRIKNEIQTNLVLAQDIRIKKKFPNALDISFKKREEVIIWCQRNSGDCFLVDGEGEAFYKVNNIDDFINDFPVILNGGNLEINIGEVVIDSDLVKFCSEVSEYVEKETGIKLEKEYYTPSFMSEEIKANTDKGWFIYFNSSEGAYEQSKLLRSLLDKDVVKKGMDKLEYIDLRLKGKVLYKMKGENKDDEKEDDEKNED